MTTPIREQRETAIKTTIARHLTKHLGPEEIRALAFDLEPLIGTTDYRATEKLIWDHIIINTAAKNIAHDIMTTLA